MKPLIRRWQSELKYRLIAGAQRSLDFFGLRKERRLFLPELLQQPPEGPILVLAPHPDDETLGPGGTLCLAARAGAEVSVVVLTDGSEGLPPGKEREARIALRKGEVWASCAALGLKPPLHLDLPDSRLDSRSPEARQKLEKVLQELRPRAIFLPFPIDYHGDHLETNRLLVAVAGREASYDIWCYESSAPVYPNVIVEIGGAYEAKKAAILAHRSQGVANDYVHTILEGLNRFRTFGLLGGKGYAEGFYRTNVGFLEEILRAIGPL